MKNIIKFLIILPLFIFACQKQEVPGVLPTTNPSTVVTASPQESPNVTLKGSLTVVVTDGASKQNIAGATVRVTSTNGTNLSENTNSEGKATFENLPEGVNYNIDVSANNFQANSASTSSAKLEIKANKPVSLTINLFKFQAILSGRILNENENPIEGAVIKVGNNSGLSEANGTFSINVTNISVLPISIIKTGYTTYNYGNVDFSKTTEVAIGEIKMVRTDTLPLVFFDTSKTPFGNIDGNNIDTLFTKFAKALSAANYRAVSGNFFSQGNRDEIDALVIASPSVDYTDSEIETISSFIKSGKKLVVLGEWGGFGGFKIAPVNKLLKEANIRINPDIVKEVTKENFQVTDEQIVTSTFNSHYITRGLTSLVFYSSATVEVINGGIKTLDSKITKLLAFSTTASFRIQVFNRGQFGFAAVSTLGAGKVIAVGDSSVFADSDTNSNGISNFEELNNKQFALNIFSW
jgi:hypothetical protein